MILREVMDDLGEALKVIPGLRVKPYTEQRVMAPMAMVSLPRTYTYDATYDRGSDDIEIPIVVMVGRIDAESARNALGPFVDPHGEMSIKRAVENHQSTVWDIAHVLDAQFLVMASSGAEYLTATFRVRIVGSGRG
jgi:3-polyprenyl-4-hydroxybenzoate decarboxylase